MTNKRKLKDSTVVTVYNNTNGVVGFDSESTRKRYRWDLPDSQRDITFGELKELAFSAGGYTLLRECLLIKDPDVRIELGLPVEKEHLLDKNDIVKLLSEGSADELQNVLETTNEGVKEKTAAIAIEIEITDTKKMDIIKEYTGVDVYEQIKEKQELAKEQEESKNKNKKK